MSYRRYPPVRPSTPDLPWWFKACFAVGALASLAMLAGIGWLVIAAIQWLGRH